MTITFVPTPSEGVSRKYPLGRFFRVNPRGPRKCPRERSWTFTKGEFLKLCLQISPANLLNKSPSVTSTPSARYIDVIVCSFERSFSGLPLTAFLCNGSSKCANHALFSFHCTY